jgi:hypothetical protein
VAEERGDFGTPEEGNVEAVTRLLVKSVTENTRSVISKLFYELCPRVQ